MTPATARPPTPAPLMGAILAGGRSRRMGAPKEAIRLADGRPMIEHVIDAIRVICPKIAIVGACEGYPVNEKPDLIHLPDLHPGLGPLAGLEALLVSGLAERYLIATCDQPLLRPQLLMTLAESPSSLPKFIITESGTRLDPFPCALPAQWLGHIQRAVAHEDLSVRELVRNSNVEWLTVPDDHAQQIQSFNSMSQLIDEGVVSGSGDSSRA